MAKIYLEETKRKIVFVMLHILQKKKKFANNDILHKYN